MNPEPLFGHEKLEVYKRAIEFVAWADVLLEDVPRKLSAHDQLDRSSTSIPINIAEGNGKWHPQDRCRFFDISWGSSLESASVLDVLVAKRRVTPERIYEGKLLLAEIVRMLVGLIKANDPERRFGAAGWNASGRVKEELGGYSAGEEDEEQE